MSKVVVYHATYGCETGCCGHVIFVDGKEIVGSFEFDHPYGEDYKEWAKEFIEDQLGKEHVSDLDWDNCLVSDE